VILKNKIFFVVGETRSVKDFMDSPF